MFVPVASVVIPADNAVAEPPEEPPGVMPGLTGLRAIPQNREWHEPRMRNSRGVIFVWQIAPVLACSWQVLVSACTFRLTFSARLITARINVARESFPGKLKERLMEALEEKAMRQSARTAEQADHTAWNIVDHQHAATIRTSFEARYADTGIDTGKTSSVKLLAPHSGNFGPEPGGTVSARGSGRRPSMSRSVSTGKSLFTVSFWGWGRVALPKVFP